MILRGFVVKVQCIAPLVALVALGVAGCGQPPAATFSRDERTEDLIPEARDLVDKVLSENFGTPNKLVAWEKFPIDYGKPEPQADSNDPHSKAGGMLKESRTLYITPSPHCPRFTAA